MVYELASLQQPSLQALLCPANLQDLELGLLWWARMGVPVLRLARNYLSSLHSWCQCQCRHPQATSVPHEKALGHWQRVSEVYSPIKLNLPYSRPLWNATGSIGTGGSIQSHELTGPCECASLAPHHIGRFSQSAA
jgi:hypothetical protein